MHALISYVYIKSSYGMKIEKEFLQGRTEGDTGENSGVGKEDKYVFSLMYRIHIYGMRARVGSICRGGEGTRKT